MASNWEISLITRSILIFFCYISRYVCTQNTFSCEKNIIFDWHIHIFELHEYVCISLIQYCHQSFIKSQLKVQKVLLVIWEFLLHNMAYQKEPWETKKSLREVCFCFFDQLQFDNLGRGVLQKNEIYERTWLEHDFIHSHCLVPHCKFWWSFVQF